MLYSHSLTGPAHTLAEKVLARTSGLARVIEGEFVFVEPDLVVMYDAAGLCGLMRDIRIDPDRIALCVDHILLPHDEAGAKVHKILRDTAERFGIKRFFDVGKGGMSFDLMAEEGLARPGMLVVHVDPHVSTLGGLGVYGVNVGSDVLSVLRTGKTWLKVPGTVRVEVTGTLPKGVTSRDLFGKILMDVGPDGMMGQVMEFAGSTIDVMSVASRMALCNSVQYLCAETAVVNPDEITIKYMKPSTTSTIMHSTSDRGAKYTKTLHYDVSAMEPMVVEPPEVYCVRPLREVEGTLIHQAFLGTCASGRLEDLRMAATILRGRQLSKGVRLIVTPVTQKTFVNALQEGLVEHFVRAGAVVTPPTCSPCFAGFGGFGYLLPGETCISTGTSNIPGRMGSAEAKIYLANPATVTASAIKGAIADPREFL